ncbi:unnamed protein product [Leuciscus chuanchicus]
MEESIKDAVGTLEREVIECFKRRDKKGMKQLEQRKDPEATIFSPTAATSPVSPSSTPCFLPANNPTASTTSRPINRTTDEEFCATIPVGPDLDPIISILPFSREQLASAQGADDTLQGLTISPTTQPTGELRQIPDNQEVFAHSQTDQSIIIELLEYQSQVQDAEAARYHFEDVAASNKAVENGSWEVRGLEQLSQSELSMQECSSAWLLSGAQLVSKFNEEAKNTVNIHLCLFRLPQYTTDILVTFNDPVCINPLSSSAVGNVAATPWTLQDFQGVLQSFCLLDPGVFG